MVKEMEKDSITAHTIILDIMVNGKMVLEMVTDV
jgi:hypothetical protein